MRIYINKEGLEREIPRADLAELSGIFQKKVTDKLREKNLLASSPSRGVLVVRRALTDADPNIPLLNIHPGSIIAGGGIGGATVEMAVEYSMTGELLVAATGSRKGAKYKYAAGLTKWGHTEEVLNDFADLIAQRVSEVSAG